MSEMINLLRAIVRDELAQRRGPEIGIVTAVEARDADGSENNHQVNVRLRTSGVELQRVPVAVARVGLSMLPRVDDLVLVVFIKDDFNAPVVGGCVYDEKLLPPPLITVARQSLAQLKAQKAQLKASDTMLGIIGREEMPGVSQTLNAAALTYLAAFLTSLMYLIYFVMLRGRD